MKEIILVDDKWKITSDKYNFILKKKVTTKKKESWKTVGYYGTIKDVVGSIVVKDMKELPDEISDLLKKIDKETDVILEKIKNAL